MCNHGRNLATIPQTKPIPVIDNKIKWHIDESRLPNGIEKYKVILAFEKSFEILSRVFAPVTFESTDKIEDAPIILRFRHNGDSDLPEQFGQNVLAFAYGNYDNYKYSSDVFFNIDIRWWDMHKPNFFSLKKVCVHECLHALGFDHSNIQTDIMFWQYQLNDEINFSLDTKQAIRNLYPLVKSDTMRTFLLSSNILNYITNRDVLILARELGIEIDSRKSKSTNIAIIKSKL